MNRRCFLFSAGASTAAAAVGGAAWYAYDGQSLYTQPGGPYSAWREWTDTQGAAPAALLKSAVLASSPHNTQPWRFRVGAAFVELFLDARRSVAGLDPFLREAHIGMGCALENLALAAGAHGLTERIEVPDGRLTLQPAETLRMVARTELAAGTRRESELYAAIPNRHTNRGLYDAGRQLAGAFVEQLRALNEGDARVFVFDDAPQKDELVRISAAANRELYADAEVEAGNQRWIRWRTAEIRRHADGITIDNFGLPPAMTAVVKMAPTWVVQRAATPAKRSEMYEPQMQTASVIGVIAVRDRMSVRQSVEAGRIWQRAHLLATARGVAARPCNEAVEMIDYECWRRRPARRLGELAGVIGEAGWESRHSYSSWECRRWRDDSVRDWRRDESWFNGSLCRYSMLGVMVSAVCARNRRQFGSGL
jgi:hypothetical protein